MIAPYTDEPRKVLSPDDERDLREVFCSYVEDGLYDDARHLLDSVRAERPALADRLYQIAAHTYNVILD